jgi:microcystin-dependent protein
MGDAFMGEIRMFGCYWAPKTWALCNGQFMPINQNQALFSLLGTMYGGNGQTTFALPDMRGRIPMHFGSAHSNTGEAGGAEAVTITAQTMPTHNHVINATTTQASATDGNLPDTTKRLAASIADSMYKAPSALVAMAPGTVSTVGGSQPHTNMMPYATINFCIALSGIFPSNN